MWAKAAAANVRLVARVTPPSASISARMPSYRAGSTTTVTDSKFFAAARIMAGPPMSMFSITASASAPLATVSRNG